MANNFELEGSVKLIGDVQTFASGFSKREFVVEVEDGRFTQAIKFECLKDKTSLTDGLSEGDRVKVTFDIRGNEYKDRYFVNLVAWKIEQAGSGSPDGGPPPGDEDHPPLHLSEPPAGHGQEGDDDIPF